MVISRKSVNEHKSIFNHKTIEKKYESLYIRVIQTLIEQIEEKFNEENKTISFINSLFSKNLNDLTLEEIEINLNVYKDIFNLKQLYHELKIWFDFKIAKSFEKNSHVNLSGSNLLKIYLSMPVSSTSPERSFCCCLQALRTALSFKLATPLIYSSIIGILFILRLISLIFLIIPSV